ncbi:MAG TPA: restriction endonuclease subunit S [Plasticicumulans sp.]|uniref:restriction endonuclease subunit S n=1 Tax=Plasticicumulans sp. TaxID=2307179 RepID=UPI002C134251|nr:restriction endonuclease subunit S [Plasticicumulans sp.]HMW30983.1 restriction endonuclease subunit S [Plasticicumulans sp.]
MSLPRYPEYKDSGVEWLGEVPAHWLMKRIRFVADMNPSKSEISSIDRDDEVSFLPMEAIGEDGSLNLDRTRPISEVETGYTYFRDGDVTIAKITPCFENGKGALMRGLMNGIGFGTTELIVARPKATQVTGDFLKWIFQSPGFRKTGEAAMYGAGGQKRVPDDFVRNILWAFPVISEQSEIVEFLDQETSKIDSLIAEQKKLIALLAEKRQATISHAVTRGLDPDVPMKDSGVEWLGEVPAHWQVKRLKTISPEITVGIVVEPSKYYVDDGVPALRSLNICADRISKENLVYISKESNELLAKSRLRTGDLVSVRSGQPGATAVVPSDMHGCNCIDLLTRQTNTNYIRYPS